MLHTVYPVHVNGSTHERLSIAHVKRAISLNFNVVFLVAARIYPCFHFHILLPLCLHRACCPLPFHCIRACVFSVSIHDFNWILPLRFLVQGSFHQIFMQSLFPLDNFPYFGIYRLTLHFFSPNHHNVLPFKQRDMYTEEWQRVAKG